MGPAWTLWAWQVTGPLTLWPGGRSSRWWGRRRRASRTWACGWPQELGGEVINADSMQLYRGMDIGTAKLAPAQRVGIPHHLLDIWDVRCTANVAEYQRLARAEIAATAARGRVPILVGGSGLYLRAALDDLNFPGTDPAVRQRLEDELAARGPGAAACSAGRGRPGAARGILPSNGRRIVRALEVIELSGRPFTATLPRYESLYPACRSACGCPGPSWTSESPSGCGGCGRLAWWTRYAAWTRPGLRDGPDRQPGARLRAGAAVPGRGGDRGAGPGADHQGHPPVRPPPGGLVPPRPPGDLAGRRSRVGPGVGGAGYDRLVFLAHQQFAKGHGTENDFVILRDPRMASSTCRPGSSPGSATAGPGSGRTGCCAW